MSLAARAFCVAGTACVTAFVGCSSATPEESIASRSDAITGGAADTTHAAVMLESCDKPCVCSGTLVKKDEALGVGWILTAAHCIPSAKSEVHLRFYVQGEVAATFRAAYANTITPDAVRYSILDATRHPQYDPNAALSFDGKQAHDLGLIRVLGVGPDSPVLAVGPANDGLAKGSPIMSIGYGSTGPWNDESSIPTCGTRHSASIKVSAIDANFITASGKDPGGSVNVGDSGGPLVAMVDRSERVVGVHTAGAQNAFISVRQSARVSADLSWIEGELAKTPQVNSCNSCLRTEMNGARSCAAKHRGCLDRADCNAYALCVETCANDGDVGPTKACRDTCAAASPEAAALFYEPGFACGCQACATACGAVCPPEYLVRPATAGDGGADTASPSTRRPSGLTASDGGCSAGGGARAGALWPLLVAVWAAARRRRR